MYFKTITLCFGMLLFSSVCSAPSSNLSRLLPNTRQPRNEQFSGGSKLRNACNCVCGAGNRQSRVIGGEQAKAHEFPWIAWLSKAGEFYCGASLITKRHVLTAAHCVKGIDMNTVKVTLADHERSALGKGQITRKIKSSKIHEAFNQHTFNNDIAVLELDIAVEFNNALQPACLPQSADTDYTGHVAVLAGWGRLAEQEEVSDTLRKVHLPVWSREQCVNAGYQEKRITENMFCAGYPDGKRDACQGDSGGPLHAANNNGNTEIIGLVSWGRGCGRPQLPGVYTKVTNYLNWISESLDTECMCDNPNSI